MWAALKGDGLTPVVASGLNFAIRGGDGVVAVGGGCDHLRVENQKMKKTTLHFINFHSSHALVVVKCPHSFCHIGRSPCKG